MADIEKQTDSAPDPLIEAIVEACMTHAATNGAVDYPKAAAAFAQIMAEMIGPQTPEVQKAMLGQYWAELNGAVRLAALRHSVRKPEVVQ